MLGCLPSFGGASSPDQIVMFGLEGSGKTTFLYRLKLPGWSTITTALEEVRQAGDDPGYHYEEFTSPYLRSFGIWDVPGSAAMIPLWPMFYRYVKVEAVFFVVNGSDAFLKKEDKITEIGRHIATLLNEDELRKSSFILIINDFESSEGEEQRSERDKVRRGNDHTNWQAFRDILGIRRFEEDYSNFKAVHMNCAKVSESNETWRQILSFVAENKLANSE
uniref:ADP-ribosylation factor n=1 Tax=Zooxanthella nutricula TaxID=1333877 RepID=A0A7S2VL33_9DINO